MRNIHKYIYSIVLQLIVVAMLVVGNGAKAQYPYNFSFAGVPLDSKTIVRSYDEQRVVVYYEENGNGYVSLVDVITNDVFTVPLDPRYSMNDMCIMNDSVFLCGYYVHNAANNTILGAITTMNLNNFYSGSVLVTYFNPSYWMRLNLKRIKGFEYSTIYNTYAKFLLVSDLNYPCDGLEPFPLYSPLSHQCYTDPNDHYSMCTVNTVIEVSYPFDVTISSVPIKQKVIRIMNPMDHSEIIHDVVVTDNYVAFVGVKSGTIDSITLHICNKGNNILNPQYTSSNFNHYYRYSLGTSSGTPFYHACALSGDNIAIVTQDEMSVPSNDITIRTFNLTTPTMTLTQHLQCYSYPDLKDVAYNPNLKRLVLLYQGYFKTTGSYCDIFCTVDPFNGSPSYVLPGITDNVFHLKFGSLDAMSGDYFITTGGKYGFVSDAGNWGTGRICYDVEDYNIVKRSVIIADTGSFTYDRILPNPDSVRSDTICLQVQIPTQCIDN